MTNLTSHQGSSFDWSYPCAFVWGLIVLVSLIGWGQTVGSWLVTPDRDEFNAKWGLAAAWGMAIFLILSGPLIALSRFSRIYVVLFLLVGVALKLRWIFSVRVKSPWADPPTIVLKWTSAGLLLLIVLTYAGAVANHAYNSCDDFAAYFAYAKMLLDTGTLSDPFSFRLIMSLGGQQALSTLIVTVLPWKYTHLLDEGVSLLIVLGMTQQMVSGDSSKVWTARLILVALALTFSMPSVNVAGTFTGTALLMALLKTFDLVASRRLLGWRSALLLGGTIAATATLRGHYPFVIAALGIGFLLWRLWEGDHRRGEVIREATMTFAVVIIFLTPWWVAAYRSSESFLYPLVKGTLRNGFDNFSQHLPLPLTLAFVFGFFMTTPYLLLLCPASFLSPGRKRRALLFFGGSLFVISAAFVSQYTYGNYPSLYRYLAPVGVAFGLYSAGVVADDFVRIANGDRDFFRARIAPLGVALALVALVAQSIDFPITSWVNIFRIRHAIDARYELSDYAGVISTDKARRDYQEAFARIPQGSKTLIALDYPFLVDYRQHSIFGIDVPGEASPNPGMPYFRGADPLKKYLLAQGIHYVAHVPFDQSTFLHSREKQMINLRGPIPVYRDLAKYELDFFDNVDQLAKSNQILYDSPTIQVIALSH